MFPFNTDELLHVATCHHLTLFRDRRGTRHGTCTLPSLVAVAGMRRIGNSLSLFLWLARLLPVCELQKLLRLRMQLAEKLRICITTGRDAGTDREKERERQWERKRVGKWGSQGRDACNTHLATTIYNYKLRAIQMSDGNRRESGMVEDSFQIRT